MNIRLVGFTGDVRGLESSLVEMAPVVVLETDEPDDSSTMYAAGLAWDRTSLVESTVGDERFMHFIRASESLREGETVWLAGAGFLRMLKACPTTTDEVLRIGAWQTMAGGYRWQKGPRLLFRELTDSIAKKSRAAMHRALFDSMEINLGAASEYFDLFDSSATSTTHENALDRAIYFFERRDIEQYEWIRDQAVIADSLYESSDDFLREFEKRRRWLQRTRFAQSPHSMAMTANRPSTFDVLALLQEMTEHRFVSPDISRLLEARGSETRTR